ncbi:hypothetical protein [Phenylobacterium sp.]|uniref:hypothetical protein n=1 Tax=Phenylobacterium sp. TaxID=1871053 RepID=UPI0011FFB1CD|nr:hypothetical protein [Phenylobacterium sp.]THD63887.1 MAG: hypothetical protein E8A49_04215 [Phenylobacterium sp.]
MRSQVLFAALVIAAVAGPAAAAQAETFDLVCTGQTVDAAGVSTPFDTRLSVDLTGKHWCDRQVGCPYVFPVLARRGEKLQLLAVKTPLNEAVFDVNLKTGAFTRNTRIPDRPNSPTAAKGLCKPASFTPFG